MSLSRLLSDDDSADPCEQLDEPPRINDQYFGVVAPAENLFRADYWYFGVVVPGSRGARRQWRPLSETGTSGGGTSVVTKF